MHWKPGKRGEGFYFKIESETKNSGGVCVMAEMCTAAKHHSRVLGVQQSGSLC